MWHGVSSLKVLLFSPCAASPARTAGGRWVNLPPQKAEGLLRVFHPCDKVPKSAHCLTPGTATDLCPGLC